MWPSKHLVSLHSQTTTFRSVLSSKFSFAHLTKQLFFFTYCSLLLYVTLSIMRILITCTSHFPLRSFSLCVRALIQRFSLCCHRLCRTFYAHWRTPALLGWAASTFRSPYVYFQVRGSKVVPHSAVVPHTTVVPTHTSLFNTKIYGKIYIALS